MAEHCCQNKVQLKSFTITGKILKAYSLDLRQKIVDTYRNESISQRQLAKRFRARQEFCNQAIKAT